jgi:hypothetical protein
MDWKTTRFYALLTLLVSLGFAAAAGAQETSTEETTTVVEPSPVLPMSLAYFQPRYSEARWDVHRIKANKCRTHIRPHVWPDAGEVAPGYREERLARTRARRAAVRELSSKCFSSWPAVGQRLAAERYGWTGYQWTALYNLWNHESGWDPYQWNNAGSGACGIPQFLPCRYYGDGYAQIVAGLAYIRDRYGSPANAWAFSQANGWY